MSSRRHPQLLLLLAGTAALGVSACGSSNSLAITGHPPAGYRTQTVSHFSVAIPANAYHSGDSGATGRVVDVWGLAHDFQVTAVYDPHPGGPISQVVASVKQSSAQGLSHATTTVRTAALSGARSAQVISTSGRAGGQKDSLSELVAALKDGGQVTVEVISHGASAPSPASVIDSVKLTR